MGLDNSNTSGWDLESGNISFPSQKIDSIYLFNERSAITFSYHPEQYETRFGSFSRLLGAEVYVGAIWNSLVWHRPDICFFEEGLRDEILAMLVTTTISHEITHDLIDAMDPSHFEKTDFEDRILREVDVAIEKDFLRRISKRRDPFPQKRPGNLSG